MLCFLGNDVLRTEGHGCFDDDANNTQGCFPNFLCSSRLYWVDPGPSNITASVTYGSMREGANRNLSLFPIYTMSCILYTVMAVSEVAELRCISA